jgi:SAM-dependent methyltransferase
MSELDIAVNRMLSSRSGNPWFIDVFWPEIRARTLNALADIQERVAPGAAVLDIGCFDGFSCELLTYLGFEATGSDAWSEDQRDRRFSELGIRFLDANFNEAEPLLGVEDSAFEAVYMGEVIEHVLHHPLGLLRDVWRVLAPGGWLALTTPNPSTAMNAWRVLADRHSLWGTEDSRAITVAHVHYREYTRGELHGLLEMAGFRVERSRFFPVGATREQSVTKRALKGSPSHRLCSQRGSSGAHSTCWLGEFRHTTW